MTSPAQRYAAAARKRQFERSPLGRFAALYDFELDEFQLQGCQAIDGGNGVLVAAPTGAGKTVVGEYAVFKALEVGKKAFYTTPIKALSNQKYTDFLHRHGPDNVGLLTGDTSINPEAPIVVMTTEVLRNMIYASSPTLQGLGYVVMDEVHYLADRFRGPVWEEVILHLDSDIQLVSLSATVSNAEEFGHWLEEVRGATEVVVSEHRPVPLWQHVMVGNRLLDLYSAQVDPTNPGPNPPISPELIDAIQRRHARGGQRRRSGRQRHHRSPFIRPPSRITVVDQLDRAGLLPAIVFVFSRAGCDDAVRQLVAAGTSLTTNQEQDEIHRVISRRTKGLPPEDLDVLDFWRWQHALMNGVAAHHAGMLPVFKETVEELFSAGLIKVVFATETLALGINMPARSVVLERLVKWDGQRHADLTAGEYTQLTGRAGRRGIDVEGHAVVLYSTGLDPVALAGLASRRTYPLKSAFRPTYNMAVNLLSTTDVARAREILETSFAQFQADRAVVGLARKTRKLSEAMEGYAKSMSCHLGDFEEYMRLRQRVSQREKELSRARSKAQREAIYDVVSQLHRGDVIRLPRGRRRGHAVVLERPEIHADGPMLTVLTDDARLRRLIDNDIPYGTRVVTQVTIGKKFNSRSTRDRVDLASTMRSALGAVGKMGPDEKPPPQPGDDKLENLRAQMRQHPCHGCHEREDHARWANRWARADKQYRGLIRRIEGRTSSIAREFDRVTEVLITLGYLARDNGTLTVTDDGTWLRRIYTEQDLVVAQALRDGIWADLDAASLAGVVSAVLFEPRSDDPSPTPGFHDAEKLRQAVRQTSRLTRELIVLENDFKLEVTSPLDMGIVMPMYLWARGHGLDVVLADTDLAAGDFVRWARQVLDLLDQIAIVATTPRLRRSAREAIDQVRRGVVAQGSLD